MTAMNTKRGAYASINGAATTQASTAINAIKDYILQAHLRPGDPLPTESQLCTDLGMSRSSIREAVRTLVALDDVEGHQCADGFADGLAGHAQGRAQLRFCGQGVSGTQVRPEVVVLDGVDRG